MSELTVREHNEQLILEREALRARLAGLEAHAARLITVLMAGSQTRLISRQDWEQAPATNVSFTPDENGDFTLTVTERLA